MNPKQLAKWAKIRAKGEWRFVVFRGVSSAVFVILSTSLAEHYLIERGFQFRSLAFKSPFHLMLFTLISIMAWNRSELEYTKTVNIPALPTLWQKIYAKGFLLFIVVLCLSLAFTVSLLSLLYDYSFYERFVFPQDFFTDFFFGLIGGFFLGFITWIVQEREDRKWSQNSTETKQ